MSKQSRKEIKQPDAFITFSDKIIKWVETHHKTFLSIVGILVVGGALVAGVGFVQKRQEKKAMQALYEVEKSLNQKIEKLEKDHQETVSVQAEEAKKKSPAKVEPLEKTPELLSKHLTAEVQQLKKFVKDNSGKKASVVGRLTLSQIYSDFGEPKASLSVLQEGLEDLDEGSLFYGLIHQRLGAALASVGSCDQARQHFEKVVAQPELEVLHAEAHLNIGLCQEKMNQLEEAEKTYNEVAEKYSETDAGRSAKTYARLLKLQALREVK